MRSKALTPLFIFLSLVALGMIGYALYDVIAYFNFKNKALISEGTIIDFDVNISKDKKNREVLSYAPIFSYYVKESDRILKKKSPNYKKEKTYKKGDKVSILYKKEDPRHAMIEGNHDWRIPIFLMIFGLIALYFSSFHMIHGFHFDRYYNGHWFDPD